MSPRKKKFKKCTDQSNTLKRQNESEGSCSKRAKAVKNDEEELQVQRRKNFIRACQEVSYKAYFDHRARLLLLFLPPCMKNSDCKHNDSKNIDIKEILPRVEEAFMIDMRANMWCEALEVCILSITPTQYLSANVLKEIVEIMLNAHDDEDAEYTLEYLLSKCQQVLMQNFSTHPPCLKKQLRLCYNKFLTSPLNLKEKTFTNRNEFGSDKGIVKYCMNRLEYEISSDSKNGSLVDKCKNIPEEMKRSIKGLYWQKEKFEIYELLERNKRVDRLMAVLESIIEMLQFDLAIWHGRYTDNLGIQIMRSNKPLMAYILWSNDILITGAVNSNCKQILKIFAQMVHLQYPEKHIKTITIWINAVIQTIYICETNSNSDYPNTGKYCKSFATQFYKIISEMPHDSIVRILETIKPSYMKNLIGALHLQKLLSTEEDCVITNLINFIKASQWNQFPEATCEIKISKGLFPKPIKIKRLLPYLAKKCNDDMSELDDISEALESICYPKMDSQLDKNQKPNRNHVIQTLYHTLDAYLDAYSISYIQETVDRLNERLLQHDGQDVTINTYLPELNSYSITEQFVRKYRSLCQALKVLVGLLHQLKGSGDLPDVLEIFKNIDLLGFHVCAVFTHKIVQELLTFDNANLVWCLYVSNCCSILKNSINFL